MAGVGPRHEKPPSLFTEHDIGAQFARFARTENEMTRTVSNDNRTPLLQRLRPSLNTISPLLSYGISGRYSRADLVADLKAGSIVSVLLIPQAIAYALLADLPPEYGLYCALVPVLVFALMSSSRHTCVGPFALVSLLVADLVHSSLPEKEGGAYIEAVLLLSLLTGTLQVILGLVGFGFMVRFLSDSVVSGFTSGAAILIMCSQLKYLLGMELPRATPVYIVLALFERLEDIHLPTLALSVASVGTLVSLKKANQKYFPTIMLPEQLVVVVVTTFLSYLLSFDSHAINLVGTLPSKLPAPRFPTLVLSDMRALLPSVVIMAIVSYVLTVSLARVMAKKKGYTVSPDQELLALGCANMIGSVFQAYPACGSLSRTAVCVAAGGHTQGHGIVQAATIVLALLAFTKLLAPLPYCVLAALVVTALQSLLKVHDARMLLKVSRGDFAVWATTFLATVILGVQSGVALGVVASLLWLLQQTARPFWAELGRLPSTHVYRNVRRYKDAQRLPGILVFRFDAPLHFANKDYFCEVLIQRERRFRQVVGNVHGSLPEPSDADSCHSRQLNVEMHIRQETGAPESGGDRMKAHSDTDAGHGGESSGICTPKDAANSSQKNDEQAYASTSMNETETTEIQNETVHVEIREEGGSGAEYFSEIGADRVPFLFLVLESSGILNIDAPALEMLRGLVVEYKKRSPQVTILLAGQKGPLRLALRKAGLIEDFIGENNLFIDLHEAVYAAESRVQDFKRDSIHANN